MGSVRGFRVECQVREAGGFFGGHTYAAARVTLERGRDEIKYLQCTKLSPGIRFESGVRSPNSAHLRLRENCHYTFSCDLPDGCSCG